MKKMLDKHEELLAVVPAKSKPYVECMAALKMVVDGSNARAIYTQYTDVESNEIA